jgi:hypothetical protein
MKSKLPKFKNGDQERDFWASHDSTKYADWKKAKRVVLPNLKPSVKTISFRLPESMLEEFKTPASKRELESAFFGEENQKEVEYEPSKEKSGKK